MLGFKKNLVDKVNFSKTDLAGSHVLVFVFVFALVGGAFIWRSFAASPPLIVSLQAEKMTIPAGASVYNAQNAGGNQAVKLTKRSILDGNVNLSSDGASISIRATSDTCNGLYPSFEVAIDGNYALKGSITSTSWLEYSSALSLKAGNHHISILVDNNGLVSAGCDKYIFVDAVNIYGNPPASLPTLSITASPTNLTVGESSTLTWSSTNATSCTATGAWTGTKATSGSASTGTITAAGSNSYSLTCSSSAGSATANAVITAIVAPTPVSSSWTTPACAVTASAGAELSSIINNSANTGLVICLPDGNYKLTQTLKGKGVKIWAKNQNQAKISGWIEAYGAGTEFHGVSINNTGYQMLQVYSAGFVFADGTFSNGHQAGGFYLGSGTYGVASNVSIVRNKIYSVGRLPGGTGADHAFYADSASGYITDNWLWDNIGFGIQFYPHASGLHFDNNVINTQQVAAVIFASTAGNNSASRNIIANTSQGFTACCNVSSGNVADHTWFYNVPTQYVSASGNYSLGGGDGAGNPLFTDAANHNYNLLSGTPATGYGPKVKLP
jgi:hypothetical protein